MWYALKYSRGQPNLCLCPWAESFDGRYETILRRRGYDADAARSDMQPSRVFLSLPAKYRNNAL